VKIKRSENKSRLCVENGSRSGFVDAQLARHRMTGLDAPPECPRMPSRCDVQQTARNSRSWSAIINGGLQMIGQV
jgi:hypothetical protein